MRRWAYKAIWGARNESVGAFSDRVSLFLDFLRGSSNKLGRWFVRGEFQGRAVLWDATGKSRVILTELERNLQHTEFGQGLRPMVSHTASLIDGGSTSDAEILLQHISDAPPLRVWFPDRIELSFTEVPNDELLRSELSARIFLAMAEAFAPWFASLDFDGSHAVSADDEFDGRPIVGRATYLSNVYGAPARLASAKMNHVTGGVIVALDRQLFSASEEEDLAVARVRDELRLAGVLLSREEYDARLALGLNS